MKARHALVALGLLPLAGCDNSTSPVGGNEIVHTPAGNEMGANTAVSVFGPEGNASNAAAAALAPDARNAPDYNVSGLDARPEKERGSLGGRPGK
jgi:hypothetical protein